MSLNEPTRTEKALRKANEALQSAEYNLKGGFLPAVANRAYYSCYYCMTGLLYMRDIYPKTHQGAKTKFTELFVKSGILPISVGESATLLYNYRQAADYDLDGDITQPLAELLVAKATEVYTIITAYLQNNADHLV